MDLGKKQEYIIETQGQYPKKVCFNIWGAKIAQFNIQNGEFYKYLVLTWKVANTTDAGIPMCVLGR